jgi:hypothetical protein
MRTAGMSKNNTPSPHTLFFFNLFWAVVVHAFNPSTWEVEAGRISEFKASLVYRVSSRMDSQGYTEKPCLKQNKNKKD